MIKIKHRDTGVVLATVATLVGAYLRGANLRGANLSVATLTGADLRGADLYGAYLYGANLYGADLTGAYLRGANLGGATLTGADLSGADLSGANLYKADLDGATIDTDKLDRLLARATRSDGHEFFLFALQDGSTKIKAGCRWMSVANYRAHVARDYSDTDRARETLGILDYFQATQTQAIIADGLMSGIISAMPPPELRIGVFVLRPSPNGIWIGRDGEGGEFATEHVERVIAQYYREQF